MIYQKGREGYIEDSDEYHAFRSRALSPGRLHIGPHNSDYEELNEAYCDADGFYNFNTNQDRQGRERALCYWSNALFSGRLLANAFNQALNGDGYNEFGDVTLRALVAAIPGAKDAAIFQPAREYSVAIYVHNTNGALDVIDLSDLESSKADEIGFVAHDHALLRLWWD